MVRCAEASGWTGARVRTAAADDSDEPSELRNLLDHDIPRLLVRINRSISKFGSIIDGLPRYSRTGREEYHRIEIDMAQEVAKAIELYAATVEEKGVQIYVDDLPPAFGDPDAMTKTRAAVAGIRERITCARMSIPGKIWSR